VGQLLKVEMVNFVEVGDLSSILESEIEE